MSSSDLKIPGVMGRPDNLLYVDPNEVDIVPGENPRDEDLNLDELVALIDADGFRIDRAISVYKESDDGRLKLLDGQRRLLASRQLKLPRIPAILVKGMADPVQRLIAALAANRGQELTPGSEGRAFIRLRNNGYTIDQIAAMVQRSGFYVRNRLDFLEAKPLLVEAERNGTVSFSETVQIVREADRERKPQTEVLARYVGVKEKKKADKVAARQQRKEEPELIVTVSWPHTAPIPVDKINEACKRIARPVFTTCDAVCEDNFLFIARRQLLQGEVDLYISEYYQAMEASSAL